MIPGHSSISRVPRVGATGGGGRLWTPADIPELTGWWDADSGITLNGANVSSWANKIGAGSFANSNSGPQLSSFNGNPCLQFDGGSQNMQLPGTAGVTPNFNAGGTLLCAASPTKGGSPVITVYGGQFGPWINTFNYPAIMFADRTITIGNDTWTGNGHRSMSAELGVSASLIIRGTQRKVPYMDRSPYSFGTDTSNSSTFLGYDQNGRYFGGVITAVAMAPVLLGGIDIDRWEGYYAHKTKSTDYLPASHPYKLAPPRV